MRSSTPRFAATLAVVLTTACTDPTSLQPRPRVGGASVASARSLPPTYPNSRKYRDTGFHPAVGRSGSAAIAMRALLGRSGTTDVEVTTGDFESGAASGSLAKVQVKSQRAGESFTSNFANLTSNSASFPFSGLSHGAPVQLQALVRGVDGTRTDVVSVTDAVHFRPDLVAQDLTGPLKAPIGAAVNFQVTIREQLGDLGARCNIVFYVDGVEGDRADNVWIDARGLVVGLITYPFTSLGTHSLEVRVENVGPGDYDDSNNSVKASIDVVPPEAFAAYSLQAYSMVEHSMFRSVSDFPDLEDQTTTSEGPSQYVSIGGIIHRSLQFPIRFQGALATNGATFDVLDQTFDSAPYVDWQQGYCDSRYAISGGGSTYVCVYDGGYLAGYTYVQYDWWGADVRYHSDRYTQVWDNGAPTQRYDFFDFTQIGPMVTFGNDLYGRLAITGAGDAQPSVAEATIILSPFETNFDRVDPSCGAPIAALTCREFHLHTTGVFGYMDFGAWPNP